MEACSTALILKINVAHYFAVEKLNSLKTVESCFIPHLFKSNKSTKSTF